MERNKGLWAKPRVAYQLRLCHPVTCLPATSVIYGQEGNFSHHFQEALGKGDIQARTLELKWAGMSNMKEKSTTQELFAVTLAKA